MQLEIIYEDAELVAINKPHGLLVHRTRIAADAEVFALQLLRDQLGIKVYPAHRLDRKTSGVLLFSKNPDTDRVIQRSFQERKVKKHYLAIVRGWVEEKGVIDYAIGENDKKKEAITSFTCLERYEIDVPLGKFSTSRYSLIKVIPETGRFHQIRKHMAHIFHPIIGDRPHGCSKQNRMWKKQFNMEKMMLHASRLEITYDKNEMVFDAEPSNEFFKVLEILKNK